MSRKPQYRRVLLKLSGEALMGEQKFGIELSSCQRIAAQIIELQRLGVQIGVVVGGGNIFRGKLADELGFARTPADHVGMLATAINGMVLQQSLERAGCRAYVMSAVSIGALIELYSWYRAIDYLEANHIVLFVGGTGNPYFTTDTAAALRASEMDADVLIKATTKVDGVYDQDPMMHPSAKYFPSLTYSEVLAKKLNVMDAAAVALCCENKIPIHVINIFNPGSLLAAICDKEGGSLITGE